MSGIQLSEVGCRGRDGLYDVMHGREWMYGSNDENIKHTRLPSPFGTKNVGKHQSVGSEQGTPEAMCFATSELVASWKRRGMALGDDTLYGTLFGLRKIFI